MMTSSSNEEMNKSNSSNGLVDDDEGRYLFSNWASSKQKEFLLRDDHHDSSTNTAEEDDKEDKLVANLKPNVNVIVAKDGRGQVKTIKEALDLVPVNNTTPFIIYVKEGTYDEQVIVESTKLNVYIIGDGMSKTIVTGNKSVHGDKSIDPKSTATFSVSGKGFVAKDMGFRNTAGPENYQAVALSSDADNSIFYRCLFDAYQDTLYAASNRQFYRECDIIGTIDFIFGNAAVVFQRCNILPREPLPYQTNIITAQGNDEFNGNRTGISIHECTIRPHGTVTRPTYLGRPWKNYSTTVIMKTEISGIVHPAGWLSWDGRNPPRPTINYAEFQNTGPGADVFHRVTWPGYSPSITPAEANKYTVASFINGPDWIPPSNVPFEPNL